MVKLLLCIQKTACLNLDQINGYFTGYFVIVCYRYAAMTDYFVIFSYHYAAKTEYFVVYVTGTQQRLIIL